MKVRQKTICQGCRKGKIRCDGKKPACSQCLFRGLECPGYPADWVFVPQSLDHSRKPRSSRVGGRRREADRQHGGREEVLAESGVRAVALAAGASLPDLISIVIDNYVPEPDAQSSNTPVEPSPRICGSWVEVLPELVGNVTDTALASAIRAFAVTILSKGPKCSLPVSDGLEAYNQALVSVNCALGSRYSDFPVTIAAAVMCLLLAEMFHVTSLNSWSAHLEGLAGLMQLSRPEAYVSGIPHRLFVGARPALVVLSFVSRKASFLAEEQWRVVPFRETGPSPVQALMSEAVAIPGILERMDKGGTKAAAEEVLHCFEVVLGRLDAWADDFHASALPSCPIFWVLPRGEDEREKIWFRDITAANALTHYWAFRVVCLQSIRQLRATGPQTDVLEETKRLSTRICQSIEYLMQDKMKLFGPTSVALPLRTAYETFQAGGDESSGELQWCSEILADLSSHGYGFVTFIAVPDPSVMESQGSHW